MPGIIVRLSRTTLVVLILGVLAFGLGAWLRWRSGRAVEVAGPAAAATAPPAASVPDADLPAAVRGLEKGVARLQGEVKKTDQKLARLAPRGNYIVIDSANNHLWVKRGGEVLREATCSTGSGRVLEDPTGGRSWTFSTPRGEFKVQNRLENPMWRKPDWAFIEEGEPVPDAKDAVERFEDGVLGAYALAFGDGYLIHGTLYTRLLGKSVTHGCVRLGAEDLEAVFDAAPLHTKVLIF